MTDTAFQFAASFNKGGLYTITLWSTSVTQSNSVTFSIQ